MARRFVYLVTALGLFLSVGLVAAQTQLPKTVSLSVVENDAFPQKLQYKSAIQIIDVQAKSIKVTLSVDGRASIYSEQRVLHRHQLGESRDEEGGVWSVGPTVRVQWRHDRVEGDAPSRSVGVRRSPVKTPRLLPMPPSAPGRHLFDVFRLASTCSQNRRVLSISDKPGCWIWARWQPPEPPESRTCYSPSLWSVSPLRLHSACRFIGRVGSCWGLAA